MDFEALLESLINPGPDGPEEGIFDQLRTAHTGALEGRDNELAAGAEALAIVEGERDAALASLVEVKAMNFDKLMSAGTESDGDPDLKTETLDETDSEGEMTTDEFFETEKD